MSNQSDKDVSPRAAPRRPRVLLLEDHADTLKFMSKLLERLGLEVIPATTCSAARQAAQNLNGFDLLIADAILDDGDGVALASELKTAHRCTVLITSGLSPQLNGDVDHWIPKPIKVRQFEETITQLIAHPPPPK